MSKRPITIEDLYQIKTVEDPRISPDGQWIAYVLVTPDKMDNGYKRNIWLVPVTGGTPVQITRSGKDSQPRWSPDGRTLAFTSARDKKPQIYLLPVAAPGGEPRALTSMSNGATTPVWSPDGTRIAFLAQVNAEERDKEDSGEEEAPPADQFEAKQRSERKEHEEKKRWDPRIVWRIPYRQGTSYLDDRYAQVYVMLVAEGLEKDAAKPRRLTHVDASYAEPTWTPDGAYLLSARTIEPDGDLPWRSNSLYRINAAESTEEQITGGEYSDFSPVASPDGQWIAYVRLPQERLAERLSRLSVMPIGGGESRDLNLELDRDVVDFRWTPDSKALIFAAESEGNCELYRVTLESGVVNKLVAGEFNISALDVSQTGAVVYVASTPTVPADVYGWAGTDSEAQRLTQVNDNWLDEVIVQEKHEVRFASPGGQEIQGWYMLPVDYEEGQTYPLAFNIHGGPHVMWGSSTLSIWHETQVHAAQGYAVFYCNPRGAGGYGEAFQSALHGAWGDVAFEDLMAGIDTVLAQGFVDEKRMAVTGGSYGGYMTAWIVGHTDRFVAAVSQRGVYNLLSFYGTSDVPLLITNEYDVEPWQDPMRLWEHSPLAYAHKITTPLLIMHSENDFRVPISDGEQLFAYVRRNGGTVKMIRYPREGHELSRSGEPEHRAHRLQHMLDWFDQYCK